MSTTPNVAEENGNASAPSSPVPAPGRPRFSTVPSRDHKGWKTPLFEQYWRIRDEVPGCLLFFRMGDFYELFGEDAIVAAPVLEVQLTARNKNDESPIPMCGVPAHAVDSYAEKLLGAGLKVALCEQLQDPSEARNKLVERGVVRILTPGLPVDPDRLQAREPHYLLSLSRLEASGRAEISVLDFLGGRFFEGEVASLDELFEVVRRVRPREVLIDPVDEKRDLGDAAKLRSVWTGRSARERLEGYLIYTQRCDAEGLRRLLPDAEPLSRLAGRSSPQYARLPASVLEQWAVDSHLAPLLDRAGSAVGSRMLREILTSPLRDAARLRRRQALLESLADPDAFLETAAGVYDFERCLGRFRVGAAAPKELLRVLLSFRALDASFARAAAAKEAAARVAEDEGLPPLEELARGLAPLKARLEAALDVERDVARADSLSSLLRAGFDPEMDRLKDLLENSQAWLTAFEERLQRETSISTLKVRYNRVFGYYIEVTKTHLAKIPAGFERKQTTVGGERFTCEELRSRESEILSAQSKAEARARQLLEALQDELLARETDLRGYIRHFAWLDALAGVRAATRRLERFGPWRPAKLEDGPARFDLRESRHPIVEAFAGSFVANSLELGGRAEASTRLLLLTGPNMAGKSTFMRQVGLCLLLAQCGLPVPAESLELSPVSGFFSRMGASDRIFEGESTFMVEMREAAQILREADADSFILIDEIGRGTGTQDGLAIARAVLEHLQSAVGGLTIFATHFRELTGDAETLAGVRNASLGIREWEGELVFLRRLVFEPAESSYGIHVAEMAGLPNRLLERARSLFETEAVSGEGGGKRPAARRPKLVRAEETRSQVSLFDSAPRSEPPPSPVEKQALARLRELDLDGLSPRAAWDLLGDLERLLKN